MVLIDSWAQKVSDGAIFKWYSISWFNIYNKHSGLLLLLFFPLFPSSNFLVLFYLDRTSPYGPENAANSSLSYFLLFVSAVEKNDPWLSISRKSSGTVEVTCPVLVQSLQSKKERSHWFSLSDDSSLEQKCRQLLRATWIHISRIKRCWTRRSWCWQEQQNAHCAQTH